MVLVALALLLLGSAGAVGAAEITVKTPTGPIPVGETVVVPVTVTGADRLDACDISVTADASSVVIAANTTNPVDGATLTVNTVDNTAEVSFYHLTGVTGDLTLFYVDCTPTTSGLSAPVTLTVRCIAEKGSAGTPGDDVSKKYSVVNGTVVTDRDPPVVTTLAVTPPTVSPLFPGDTRQFAAEVRDQYGSAMDVPVAWASSNPTVGTINRTTGLFTAVGAGSTAVTAKAGDRMSGAVTLTVKATPAPARVVVTPSKIVSPLNTTETRQFAAKVYDQYGTLKTVPVTWASSDMSVGTINRTTGLFTAVHGGNTTITAKAGDALSDPVHVTVYLAPASVPPAPKNPVSPTIASDSPGAVLKIVVDRQDVDGNAGFTVKPAGGDVPAFAAGMGLPEDAFLSLSITPENLKDAKHLAYSAVLTFRIPVADLPAGEKHNVRAYRYNTVSGAWEALPTEWVKTEGGYHCYAVKTSGFSVFTMVRTIGGAPAVTPPVPTPKPPTPGGGGGGGGSGFAASSVSAAVDTATPTLTPTQTPTATLSPEVVRTAAPVATGTAPATATTPARSPGFGVLAALAGAGAAFVLRGRRD
jgi:hypothetical protein